MHGLVVVRGNGEVGWIVVSPGDTAPLDTANLNITHSAVSSWYRVGGMAGRPSPSPRPQQLQHLGLVRQHRQPWQPALQSHSYYTVGWEASLSTSNISILTVALKHSQYLSALKAISFNFLSPVVTAIGLKIYVTSTTEHSRLLDPYAVLGSIGFLLFLFYLVYNFLNNNGVGRSSSRRRRRRHNEFLPFHYKAGCISFLLNSYENVVLYKNTNELWLACLSVSISDKELVL